MATILWLPGGGAVIVVCALLELTGIGVPVGTPSSWNSIVPSHGPSALTVPVNVTVSPVLAFDGVGVAVVVVGYGSVVVRVLGSLWLGKQPGEVDVFGAPE